MSNAKIEYWAGHNAIELNHSLVVREFNLITGSWTTLRIGMLYGITSGSRTSISGTPRFAFGICSGSTNVYGDSQTDHFLGFHTNMATWTYVSNSINSGEYYSLTIGQYIRRSTGPTDVVSTDMISSTMYFVVPYVSASLDKGIYPMFMDFTRPSGSTNYDMTMTVYYASGVSATNGLETDASFLSYMQQTGLPSMLSAVPSQTKTLLISESLSGSFNAINIAWNREAPDSAFLIYAVAVGVLA